MFLKRCPNCHSIEFRGVGARNLMETFLCLFLSPYRCCLCGRHFFLIRWMAPADGTA
jgi:hypothetical protein